MISAELPFRQIHGQYQQKFPQFSNTLLVVIDGQTPELAHHAAKLLVDRLKIKKSLFEAVYAPGVDPFFETQGLLYQSPDELEELANDLAQVQPFLAMLTRDQSLRGLLAMLDSVLQAAARDGEEIDLTPLLERINATLAAALTGQPYQLSWRELMLGTVEGPADRRQYIMIQPKLDYSALFPAEPAIQAVRQHADSLNIDVAHGLRLRITGLAALDYDQLRSVSRGAGGITLMVLALVLVTLTLGLRSLRLVCATLVTLVAGLLLTAAFATAAVGTLNLISVAFAVLYIGLGIDFAIHFCMRYAEFHQTSVFGPHALRQTACDVGPSLALCAVTTAIGFYSFVPTAYAGVAELGLIAGTGMFISLAASLTLLPALLHLWPPAPTKPLHLPPPLPHWLATFPARYGIAIRWGALVLTIAALLLLSRVKFDANPLNLQDPTTESVATYQALLAESTTSPWSLNTLAPDAKSAETYAKRLSALDVVDETVTLNRFIPSDQGNKLTILENLALILGPQLLGNQPPTQPSIAAQRSAIAATLAKLSDDLAADNTPWPAAVKQLRNHLQILQSRLQSLDSKSQRQLLNVLEHSLLGALPANLTILRTALKANPVQLSDLPPELVAQWISRDDSYRIEILPREDLTDTAALHRFVSAVRQIAPTATGEPVLILESGIAVVRSFQQAFTVALVVISVVLFLLLRNLMDTLLVLTPLLFAGLLTGAALILLRIPLNFANIIALPLLLGIGVDNGIHVVRKMRSTLLSRTELLQTGTVRAVLFSALTTIVGFGSLSLSSHVGTASMGQVLTIGVLLNVIATLIVLPTLLQKKSK